MIKKYKLLSLLFALLFTLSACSSEEEVNVLETSKMEAICELAVMDCYFHNVAKYTEEDATGMWWWEKDKKFWIEYSGIVSIGIDSSLLSMVVEENHVTISLPKSKVLGSKVDEATLSEESFIIDKDSAKIDAQDQTAAFSEAQAKMVSTATADTTLLAQADSRVQILLTDYVENIGELIGKTYSIEFVYIENVEKSSENSQNSEE